jgi:hypothetical protein
VNLDVYDFEFNHSHAKGPRPGLVWSNLKLGFTDSETQTVPSVEIGLPQTIDANKTIAELEAEASDLAKTILRAALSLIEEKGVTALMKEQFERDEELSRSFKNPAEET